MNRLLEAELQEEVEVEESYTIKSKDEVLWAMRKLRALHEQIKETEEISKAEIERIKQWQQRETDKDMNSIKFFEGLLQKWMLTQEQKSIKLPYGRIRFKKQRPEYLRNEEVIMKFVEDDFIKVKKSLDWSKLKSILEFKDGRPIRTDTGEVIDGVTEVYREDKFEVIIDD